MSYRDSATIAVSRRRMLLSGGATIAAGALIGGMPADAADAPASDSTPPATLPNAASAPRSGTDHLPPGQPGTDYTPVVTPNNISLPWRIVDGVKVYHLI